tara:strand:- start:2989 stop:3288 length:300 start_codon:yes stop_codon:yes gene_type:complete
LWNDEGVVQANRGKYLTRDELTEMLKRNPVEFVIANVGYNLKWIPIEKCYENWKSKIKTHVVQDLNKIELDKFPNAFAYVASEWSGKTQTRIILLEMLH